MTVEFINKENLRIARENMGLEVLVANSKITKSKRNYIDEWENGKSLPKWTQVAKLSKIYNVTEALFFTKELIERNKAIPDYRVAPRHESDERVNKLINLVISRQRWLERKFREEGQKKNPLVGLGRGLIRPIQLAELIKQKLDIRIEIIKSFSGADARKKVLKYLSQAAENQGIFVGKTISYHRLEVADMRGLSVSNEYCPFVVINRKDSVSAQIFSFVHELAHLFRKSDAISNNLEFRTTTNSGNSEEVFCNKVAAELLLPVNEFSNSFYGRDEIIAFSNIFKVSELFIFYRLKELGKIKKLDQERLEKELKAEMKRHLQLKAAQDAEMEGGHYTNAMKDSNGELFNRVVAEAYFNNDINRVEASYLLRFSPEEV